MSIAFAFNWKVSLFSITCLVVFVALGFWQLDREEEKRLLIKQQAALEGSYPLPIDLLTEDVEHGQPVALTGYFDGLTIWLHDNKVLGGQVGFEVNQLFFDDSGVAVIVNRGFVPMGRTREDIPDIPVVEAPVSLTARVYIPDGEPLLLANEVPGDDYPVVVQHIDPILLAAAVEEFEVFPHILRVLETEPGGLPRHWPVTVMLPEKHRGYAIQWFAMALAVFLAWTFFSFRRRATNL